MLLRCGPNRLPTYFVKLNDVGAIADYRFISFIRLCYIELFHSRLLSRRLRM